MELKKLNAYITGAGGGIGKQTAIALAKEGINLVLFGGNNEQKLIDTKKEVENFGVKCQYYKGDLTEEKVLIDLFSLAVNEFGAPDILVNNAGIAMNAPIEQTDTKAFDKIMNINVRVPYILTREALPYLKKSKRATIINIASVVAHAGYENQSAYGASKHALLGFTKALATEVYKDDIRVHAVSPGGVYTDMIKIARPDLKPDGMTMPEEIAEIIVFLIKHRGNAVIDEIIVHRSAKQPFLV